MAKQSNKSKISLGVIIFALVFIYLAVHMISYASRDSISMYRIEDITSLSNNDSFSGLIIREESVYNAENTGIINYFHNSNSRCSVDEVVCTIDEKGNFNDIINSKSGTTSLSSENLNELTSQLSAFSLSYNGVNFENAYTLKFDLTNSLIGYLNVDDKAALEELGVDTKYFHVIKATNSGIIEYYTDGYESFDIQSITKDNFDQTSYQKTIFKSGVNVSSDDVAYKLITSDKWSIVIQLDEELADKYKDKDRLNIEFSDHGLKTIALFEEFQNEDGDIFGKFTLSKYMIQYAGTRYLNLKVINDSVTGLKIPKTALTSSEFYAVPVEYITHGGDSKTEGFYKDSVSASDNNDTFITPVISFKDEQYAYIAKDQIDLGTVLIKPDSEDKCAVSSVKELPGVFCTNQGYATFKIIDIIDEDEDYVIARSGMSYSVTVYDNIALDASAVYEGYKIY